MNMKYNDTTQAITDRLETNDIDYEIFEHELVTTSQEAADVRENFSVDQGLKALIVKTYGGDETSVSENLAQPEPRYRTGYAMIVLPGDQKFAQKKVENALNIDDFRLADPEAIEDITEGVEIGGIPPFGSLFALQTHADEQIEDMGEVVFNAGDRRVSISISAQDYLAAEEPIISAITQ
jgi:prolyl-tRNA editing enzyme YbaK/EbsC (Cys-tRNA(Pro) deacylase)